MKHIRIQLDLKRMMGFRLVPSAHQGMSDNALIISEKLGSKVGLKGTPKK